MAEHKAAGPHEPVLLICTRNCCRGSYATGSTSKSARTAHRLALKPINTSRSAEECLPLGELIVRMAPLTPCRPCDSRTSR